MRTSRAQLSVVAPWFDITTSSQKYWIRTRRWKTPDYFSAYPLELFPAPVNPDPPPARDVEQPRTAADRSAGDHAITGR